MSASRLPRDDVQLQRARPGRVVVIAMLCVGACSRAAAPGEVSGVGTVEMVEVDVAPLTPGRVVRVLPREGDRVRPGDTLAVLTQAALPAELEAQRARVGGAQAALRDLLAGARAPERARAAADLRGAQAEVARTAADLRRMAFLAERGTVSRQQLDAARSAAAQAASRRDALTATLRLLDEGARAQQVEAAGAEVRAAQAGVRAVESTAGDLVLRAPITGVVSSRNVEPGEVLGAGQSALTLADASRPFVRIYVGQRAFPLVHDGQRATATLDAFPDRPFSGRVTAVATRAEFTPRVALTEDERADLLFAVRVDLTDSAGMLKAGLPVTVRLLGSAP